MAEQLAFDLAAGRVARDEAIAAVQDPPWASFASAALRDLAASRSILTSDDVWAELDGRGPRPIEGRAMGPVMVAGVRAGWITPSGFTQGTNPKHHADVMRVYASRLYRRG
ncbi:MAG TPA: hypothetical protein VFI34_07545 [Candidatus Limnocylindrales bacterium]|nr:hypothetical protein [Candidatus Limnocylindrales bacterium]